MTIIRTGDAARGAYRMELPGVERPAVLTWRARGEARIAESTFVPEEMRGRGIAQELVEALIADAREHGFTIVPQCSYVEAQFRRHPEWADLLADPAG